MKKCYCCDADVPDQSKFCPKCGKSMEITQDLIDRAKANDPEAQTELYERTYKTVYSRIRAKVPDNDTAMDIMQESYLSAFTNLDQLQTAATFPSWLLTIASRQVCTWYRKNGKENENIQMSRLEYENDDTISDEDDLLGQPEYREDFSPDESLDRAETGRLLSEILDTLPEDQRIILTMRYYDEMSLQEISDELGVNLSTVKTRLTAGKKKVEAKVLELEKSGTKLYSLGPVAFLVFLLHHMELFAPEISANTIIGLTAAGAGAGGVAAAHVTAGAAAKAAVVTAAKGVSVKVIAIIAAAVIVVGGGITAGVLISNNQNQETAEESETSEPDKTEETSETQETVETEEPSEQPDDTDVTEDELEGNTDTPEENSEEDTEQQESEPAENEENQEEDAQEEPAVLPTENDILNLADTVIPFWGLSTLSYSGQALLNTNQAVEMAAITAFENQTPESHFDYYTVEADPGTYYDYINVYVIPAATVQTYMTKLFGTQYQLSDFSNSEYNSAFETSIPGYTFPSGISGVSKNDNGDFEISILAFEGVGYGIDNIHVENISPEETNTCLAVIQFDTSVDGQFNRESHTMSLGMIEDPTAEYGWAITSISFNC